MHEQEGATGAAGSPREVGWRDELALQAARASTFFYAVGTVVIAVAVHDRWSRIVMMAAGVICCVAEGILAVTGRPTGKLRPFVVIVPAVGVSLAGFSMVGFLAGPAVVLTLTVMLGGLLLGRRAMVGLLVAATIAIGVIAWAMIQALIPIPDPQDISMREMLPWIRTVTLMFLAISLLGTVLIDIVYRLERSLDQLKHETLRREQAESARNEAEVRALGSEQLETIGKLAAGIAHDFNNSLTTIIGSVELMKQEYSEGQTSPELMDDVLASAQKAAHLTRQLLAYSSKAKVVLVPTDLHALIEDTVTMFCRQAQPQVRVEPRLDAAPATVLADPSMLVSALLILFTNAREAMPNGGKLGITTASCELQKDSPALGKGLAPGQYVQVEVQDTGQGIAAAIVPRIFEPFFTTKPVGKGTGLGLAAVLGTIKSFKGSITVESEPGRGTTFRILLPCSESKALPAPKPRAEFKKGTGAVLLVDDDAMVRRAAAYTLQTLGYKVTEAEDGLQALELFQSSPTGFQLVILDLQMPRMDGGTTFGELRRLSPTLPVLIWSGHGGNVDVENLLRDGAAGFVPKPYEIADFSSMVYAAIHGGSTIAVSADTE